MPIVEPFTLRSSLRPGSRLLGLDVGEKTIGLALSDPGLAIASPLMTLRRGKFTADAERLGRLIGERRVGGLVVGLPVNMDGSEGPRCQSVRQFAANLLARLDLPLAFWDERTHAFLIEPGAFEIMVGASSADIRARDILEVVGQ